jgi:hypothetical protein
MGLEFHDQLSDYKRLEDRVPKTMYSQLPNYSARMKKRGVQVRLISWLHDKNSYRNSIRNENNVFRFRSCVRVLLGETKRIYGRKIPKHIP